MENIESSSSSESIAEFIEIICLSDDLKNQLEKDPVISNLSIIRLESVSNLTIDPWDFNSSDREVLIIASDKDYNLNADALSVLNSQQDNGRWILFVGPQPHKNYTYAILNDIHKIKDFIKSLCMVIHGSYPVPIDYSYVRDFIFYSKREVKLHKKSIIKDGDTLGLWDNMDSLLLDRENYSYVVAYLWFPDGVTMPAINNTLNDFLIRFDQLTQDTDNWVWGYSSGDLEIINASSWAPVSSSDDNPYNLFPKDEIMLSIFTMV